MTHPAGPPGGAILRTGFWAHIPAQISDRVPCTSGVQGTRSQILGRNLGPKSGPQNQASRRGGTSVFHGLCTEPSYAPSLHPRLHFTRVGDGVLTAGHTAHGGRDNMLLHTEANTSISNSPERRQQAERKANGMR